MSSRAVGMPTLLLLRAMSSPIPLKRICGLRIHAWVLEKGLHACITDNTCLYLHAMQNAPLNGLMVLTGPQYVRMLEALSQLCGSHES